MSSENVEMPVAQSVAPRDEIPQETKDLFAKMGEGQTRGLDRCLAVMCKIGPSMEDVDIMEQMIVAGMTIAMIKCEETSSEEYIREVFRKLREANDRVSKILHIMYSVAIVIKTVGPIIHIGVSEEGEDAKIVLKTGEETTVTFDPAYKDKCSKDVLFVDFPGDPDNVELKLYHHILLDQGKVKLKVNEIGVNDNTALCDIVTGGELPPRSTVTFPDSIVDMPSLSEQDKKNIEVAIDLNSDILILTQTQCGADVDVVRDLLRAKNSHMLIFASIIDLKGFSNCDEIIKAADGIVMARGYSERKHVSWNLHLATKTVIARCRSVGKPSVVTSKFLQSFIGNLEPRTPDITNALQVVLEGADCFGLGYEVAFGSDPIQCIKWFKATCRLANQQISKEDLINELSGIVLDSSEVMQAVSFTAVTLSLRIDAGAIIVLTENIKEAARLSVLRPISPIISVSSRGHIARQLRCYKNVYPVRYIKEPRSDPTEERHSRIQFGITFGKLRGFIKAGDPLLVVVDTEKGKDANDTIRLMFASDTNVA